METNKNGLSIFLVDDDNMHNKVMEKTLEENINCRLYTFNSGEECLNKLANNPQIVILDYYLNSVNKDAIDGIQVLKQIKKLKPETEVIMMSSQEKLEVAKNTIKNGAYDYVVKSESAFLRTTHLIERILKRNDREEEFKNYKQQSRMLVGIIILIVATTLAFNKFYPGLFDF